MNLKASTEIFEGIRGPVESYVNIWVPLFKDIQPSVPEALIHWGHGGAMATVLFAMGGIGTFLGWQMRLGNGSNVYSFTMGKTAREMHPIIMGLASFFFLLGGQGGLVLLATQGKDILHSDHALTAIIGLGLLAVQVRYFLFDTMFVKGDISILDRTFYSIPEESFFEIRTCLLR